MFGRRSPESLLEDFSAYLVEELGRTPRTAKAYTDAIVRASKVLDRPPHKITADDLRRFLRGTTYAQSTKAGIIVAFHQLHAFGVTDGRWKSNGIAELRTPSVVNEPKAPLSSRDAHAFISHVVTPIQARAILLPLYAGLRISEASLLREEHWQGDVLVISKEIAKARKKRKVPVHPALQQYRDLILFRGPASSRSSHVIFSRLRDKLGITDVEGGKVTPHTLRRTCASELYDRHKVPWEVVAKILGHGGDVTALYARISLDKMREAIEKLHYSDGKPVQLTMF